MSNTKVIEEYFDVSIDDYNDTLAQNSAMVSRRLVTRLVRISNDLYKSNISGFDVYADVESIMLLSDHSSFWVAPSSSNISNSSLIGSLNGLNIFKDFNLDNTIEFRDKQSNILVILYIDWFGKQKRREEKLDNLLEMKAKTTTQLPKPPLSRLIIEPGLRMCIGPNPECPECGNPQRLKHEYIIIRFGTPVGCIHPDCDNHHSNKQRIRNKKLNKIL